MSAALKLRVLDLFSGIGGFSLGLERTGGFQTVAFCEIEPFPRRVLAKHWPHVPCYEDVRTLTADRLAADGIAVDVICGGFPCQDISTAGKGAGIDGARSGLWREYARLIGEIRPAFVLIENVPALRSRGADRVLADLEALGYAGEPVVVGAVHAGAPHRRQRMWLVAYSACQRWRQVGRHIASDPSPHSRWAGDWVGDASQTLADADREGLEVEFDGDAGQRSSAIGSGGQWSVEPSVGRVAHGVPSRVDRLRGLGNAVVPQIPELIGNAILASLAQAEAA